MSRPGSTPLGLAAGALFALAVVACAMTWVVGLTDAQLEEISAEVTDLSVDLPGSDVVPFGGVTGWLTGRFTNSSGWSLPGIGPTLLLMTLAGAVIVVVASVAGRPLVLLFSSWCAGAVVTVSAATIATLAVVDASDLPWVEQLSEERRALVPDPEPGAGLWLYFGLVAMGSLLCALASASSYADRYGLAWSGVVRRRDDPPGSG